MITPIDVVDSAVKIGLGALISGLATYWLAKASHHKAIEKERAQRRRDLLERAAQDVATFDDLLAKFLRKIRVWLDTNPTQPMSESERADLVSLENAVYESFNELTSAVTKLVLLGEVKCQKLLRAYWDFLKLPRIAAVAAGNFTSLEVREYRKQVLQKRDEFLEEVGKVYRTIQ